MTNINIDEKIREMTEDSIDFVINANNLLGSMGSYNLQLAIDAISQTLFVLQKEKIIRNIINISIMVNKMLHPLYELNRGEIISVLYYLQQNVDTIQMDVTTDAPTWSIKDEIFLKLCDCCVKNE